MKVVQLPEWVKDHANLHAQSHVECELGLLDPTDPAYEREYEKAFYKFCKEYYEHALIPAETEDSIKSSNPYRTPGKSAFEEFKGEFAGSDQQKGLFQTGKIKSQEEVTKTWNSVKAAVQTLERIFFDHHFGDYTFSQYHAKNNETKYREVIVNRYLRNALLMMFLQNVKNIYETDGDKLRASVEDALKNVRNADLNKGEMIRKFTGACKIAVQSFSTQNSIAPNQYANFMSQAIKKLAEKELVSSSKSKPMSAEAKQKLSRKTSKPTQEEALDEAERLAASGKPVAVEMLKKLKASKK